MGKKKKMGKAFNAKAAHKAFSASCFNAAWDLMDEAKRTPEQDEEMLRLAMASHWHWTQRKAYGPMQASMANWQISRIFSLMGQPENARRYAEHSLEALGEGDDLPLYRGYAYEALARAAALSGDSPAVDEYRRLAHDMAELVVDQEVRQALEADLATISG